MFSWQKDAWKAWTPMLDRLPHAILIQSAEGCGELEFAKGVAQSLLCEKPGANRRWCGSCLACGWFSQGNHPDFRQLLPESLTPEAQEGDAEPGKKRSEQIRVEQVRELADFLGVGTHRAGLRVILIYPAEAMNANTQNALLKSLEEPPPATVFLIVSTRADRLLPTVRSRCRRFTLPAPKLKDVIPWLKEQGVAEPESALAAVGGAPLAAVRGATTEADRRAFIAAIAHPRFDPIAVAESVQRGSLWDLVGWLQRWSFDLLLARTAGQVRYHLGHEKLIAEIAPRCDPAWIAAYLRHLAQARALARHPLNPKLYVEDLLLQYQRLVGQP
jgi:DNA polymerase-3 subunit delta'